MTAWAGMAARLAAETWDGVRLRMKMGVLLGRPVGRATDEEATKYKEWKDKFTQMVEWGMKPRQIANVIGCDRNTVNRLALRWGLDSKAGFSTEYIKRAAQERKKNKAPSYKEGPYRIVPLDRERTLKMIDEGLTIPEISERQPEYTYEQIYDTILCDDEFNSLYRKRAQLKLVKRK